MQLGLLLMAGGCVNICLFGTGMPVALSDSACGRGGQVRGTGLGQGKFQNQSVGICGPHCFLFLSFAVFWLCGGAKSIGL